MGGKRILIASGKGGVGKSSLCVSLGETLSQMGKRVVLLDLDFGIRALDLFLGVENAPYHLMDVLERRCKPADALIQPQGNERLFLCQAPPSKDDGVPVRWELMEPLTRLFAEHFDYVLADCPAGITPAFYTACRVCDEALVVTNPEPVAVRSAALCRTMALQQNPDLFCRVVIHRVKEKVKENQITDFDNILNETEMPLAAVIPFAPGISAAAAKGELATFSDPDYNEAVRRLALRLEGKKAPLWIS